MLAVEVVRACPALYRQPPQQAATSSANEPQLASLQRPSPVASVTAELLGVPTSQPAGNNVTLFPSLLVIASVIGTSHLQPAAGRIWWNLLLPLACRLSTTYSSLPLSLSTFPPLPSFLFFPFPPPPTPYCLFNYLLATCAKKAQPSILVSCISVTLPPRQLFLWPRSRPSHHHHLSHHDPTTVPSPAPV